MPTESGLKLTGFKISRTLDRLVHDLLLILRDTLTDPNVDLLRNKNDRNRLDFKVLERLSQPPYVNDLLWRNYATYGEEKGKRITPPKGESFWLSFEADNYFRTVLQRRLGVANSLKGKPTSMHLLLQVACRFGSAEQGWPSVEIKRDKEQKPYGLDKIFFQRTAEALNRQRQELDREPTRHRDCEADDVNTIAQRERDNFGPLWLIVGDCATEIADELSLFYDVLQALPTPLRIEFAEDGNFQERLQKVLEPLNTRYGRLRSCGLDPKIWFDTSDLSIDVLKKIKEMRDGVKILEALNNLSTWFDTMENQIEQIDLDEYLRNWVNRFPPFPPKQIEKKWV